MRRETEAFRISIGFVKNLITLDTLLPGKVFPAIPHTAMSSRPATRTTTTGKRPDRRMPSANDDERKRKKKRENQEKNTSDPVHTSVATQSLILS